MGGVGAPEASRRGHEVVVVGGGLVGAAMARVLGQAGVDALLVDRSERGRATDAGAGILSPETTPEGDPAWVALAQAAGDHYRTLISQLAEEGQHETGFHRCGLLTVAIRAGEDQWFAELADLVVDRAPGVEEIDDAAARALCPPIAPVRRALFNPAAARVDGRLLRRALLGGAAHHGVPVVTTGARSVERQGDRVTAVVTDEGRIPCKTVVICGGAWSSSLTGPLGVELPVFPMKGQIVHLDVPGTDTGAWPIVQPVLGYYLVCWPGGRVACGGTMEAHAGYDVRPTAAGVRDLLRECLITAPGLADATVAEVRVGLRPATPDDKPVLGRLPGADNAYVVTGHGANGLLLGPYSAWLVAQEILGQQPTGSGATFLEAFGPERFATSA